MYGDYLYSDWQDRRVPVFEYGASLGFGIVAFNVGDPWGRYYRGRPWYGRERYWTDRMAPAMGIARHRADPTAPAITVWAVHWTRAHLHF